MGIDAGIGEAVLGGELLGGAEIASGLAAGGFGGGFDAVAGDMLGGAGALAGDMGMMALEGGGPVFDAAISAGYIPGGMAPQLDPGIIGQASEIGATPIGGTPPGYNPYGSFSALEKPTELWAGQTASWNAPTVSLSKTPTGFPMNIQGANQGFGLGDFLSNPLGSISQLFGGDNQKGMGLGSMLPIASGAYGLYQSKQLQDQAKALMNEKGPFDPYRPQFAAQAAQLGSNPGSITSMPGYQAGQTAVERAMAAQGYGPAGSSGNTNSALFDYGQNFYNTQLQQAAQLGGAGFQGGDNRAALSAQQAGLMGQMGSLGLMSAPFLLNQRMWS